ncbi:MAG TPA: hypothetical protein VEX86_03305 [Longimicrobium sp.]|nr:hypothetical protein [Longimicrobium sp.]
MLPPVPNAKDTQNPHLGAALAGAAERIAPERVVQVWIFPPRQVGARETGLAVLVVAAEDEADARRTIWTLRYEAETGKGGKTTRTDALEEQGTVPPDRVDRIVDGVVRRLEAGSDAPDIRDTAGEPEAWRTLLDELGVSPAG